GQPRGIPGDTQRVGRGLELLPRPWRAEAEPAAAQLQDRYEHSEPARSDAEARRRRRAPRGRILVRGGEVPAGAQPGPRSPTGAARRGARGAGYGPDARSGDT